MASHRTILIVGAGPAGLALACGILRKTSKPVRITIIERACDHRKASRTNPDRSYTIDMTGHGRLAIEDLGLKPYMDRELIPFKGVRAHSPAVSLPCEDGWTGSRGDICCALMKALDDLVHLRKDTGSRAEIIWDAQVTEIDAMKGELQYTDAQGKVCRVQGELICAADGAGSTVRRALEASKAITCERKQISNHSRILHLDRNEPMKHLEPDWLHMFTSSPWAVGGAILAGDSPAGPKEIFVQLGYGNASPLTPAQAERALNAIPVRTMNGERKTLRHFVSDAEVIALTERPVFHTGKSINPSSFVVGRVVLLGDASAAFPPVGQGVNAAMEGAAVLASAVCECIASGAALDAGAVKYDRDWRPNAEACGEIARAVEYGNAAKQLKLVVHGVVGALTGYEMVAPTLAKDASMSYKEALDVARSRSLKFSLLVGACTAGALGALWWKRAK